MPEHMSDQFDEFDEYEPSPDCPTCGGPGVPLGALGARMHYRCRNCGMDFSQHNDPNERHNEMVDRLTHGEEEGGRVTNPDYATDREGRVINRW